MPKRRRDNIAALLISDSENGSAANCLPNNFAVRVSDLPNAGTNAKGECTRQVEAPKEALATQAPTAQEWYQKNIQASAPMMIPGAHLLEQQKDRQSKMAELERMASLLPRANRQFGTSAIEQWKGLTPPVEDILCKAVEFGLPRKTCLRLVGLSVFQLSTWFKLAAQGFSPFKNFQLRFLQAEAMAELGSQMRVEEAAAIESKSAVIYFKLLERRFKADDAKEEEVQANLPYEQFTVEELDEYVKSGGKTIPSRFLDHVEGSVIEPDDSDLRLELARLKEENRQLLLKLETDI